MKRIFLFIILIFTGVLFSIAQQLSASQILSKAVSQVSAEKGLSANFTLYNGGYSGKGSMVAKGKKFNVKLPDVEVWYNGRDLYTYSKKSGETTVINPTMEELAQSNPLSYVYGISQHSDARYSTVKKEGKYVIELIPRQKGSDIKRVTLTLNKSDYRPEKIVVEPISGQPISADITSFRNGSNTSESVFEYPEASLKGVEIIDLR